MTSPQEKIDAQIAAARMWKQRRGIALAVLAFALLAVIILGLGGALPTALAVIAALVVVGSVGVAAFSWKKVHDHTITPEYVDFLRATQNPPPVSGREMRDRMQHSDKEG